MKSHDFWVTLTDSHAPRWETILGKDVGRRLPVRSPIPSLAELPGFDVPQRVFLLALDALEPEQVAKIAEELASRFGLSPKEAALEVKEHGIPIREEHTSSVMVHNPQRWL